MSVPLCATEVDTYGNSDLSIKELESAKMDALLRSELLSQPFSMETKEYATYFGGSYINDDADLVVMLTSMEENVLNYYRGVINNDYVIYQLCNNSLNELNELKDSILDYYEQNYNANDVLLSAISSVSICDQINKVVVCMRDCDDSKICSFKTNITNSDNVIFENDSCLSNRQTGINTSAQIAFGTEGTSANGARLGFGCYKNVNGTIKHGFITCGHGNSVGSSVYLGNTAVKIGTVYNTSFYNNSNTDASFVEFESSLYSINSAIDGTDYSIVNGSYLSLYSVGTTVILANGTSGMSSGKIKSTSVTLTADGVTTNNLISASYSSKDGNSGGAVIRQVRDKYYATGIHTGRSGLYAVFSRIDYVMDDLDVTLE